MFAFLINISSYLFIIKRNIYILVRPTYNIKMNKNKDEQRIEEIKKEVLSKEPKIFVKRVSIVYDGKQYSIRIPINFAEKAMINHEKDEFEFILEISQDKNELPILHGDLIEKE